MQPRHFLRYSMPFFWLIVASAHNRSNPTELLVHRTKRAAAIHKPQGNPLPTMKGVDEHETESHGDDKETTDMVSSKGKAGSSSCRRRRSRGPSRRASLTHHAKHYVEHDYHDHYHDPMDNEGFPTEPEEEDGAKKRRGHRGGVAVPFPEKLHYMLSRMDDECSTDIVAWQPHGRCFIVRKPGEFVEKIMPRYVPF